MGGSVTASTTRSNPLNRLPLTKKKETGSLSAQTDPEEGRLIAREKRLAALVASAYRQIPKQAIYDAIESRDYQAYAVQVISALELWVDDFQEVILEQLNESGEFSAAKLASQLTSSIATVKKAETSGQSAIVGFTFDKTSTTATNYARTSAGQMVTNMASSQVQAVREAVTTAYTVGRTPTTLTKDLVAVLQQAKPTTDAARSVAELLGTNMNGLTVRYEQAVFNRSAQIATDLANRGITGTKALDKLQKETQAYADRLRKSRASTIARTELIQANNQGRLESMFQAERQGLINSETARKQWVTGRFDVCKICQTLNGETQKLRDEFSRGVMTPPAHPNCRCSINLLTNVETSTPPQAAGTGQPNDPFRTTEPTLTTIGQELGERPLPGGQPPAPKPAKAPKTPQPPKPAASVAPKPPKPEVIDGRSKPKLTPTGRPIKEEIPKFNSPQEATKWLEERWGVKYDGTTRVMDLGNIKTEAAQEVTRAIDDCFQRFPVVAERIDYFGADTNLRLPQLNGTTQAVQYKMGNAVGVASADRRFLIFREEFYQRDNWLELTQRFKSIGYWSSSDPAGTIYHEFGHHMHFTIEQFRVNPGAFFSNVPGFKRTYAGQAVIKDPISEIVRKFLKTTGKDPLTSTKLMNSLSKYCRGDVDEVVAEAIAEALQTNELPRALAVKIFDKISEMLTLIH